MLKMVFSIFLSFIIVIGFIPSVLGESVVSLQFNGKNLHSDVSPVLESGRTLVPIRIISETLGASVQWDGGNRRVIITKEDATLTLVIDQKTVYKNGAVLRALDVPAKLIKGRTMVPIRFVSEELGAAVEWNATTRTVNVVSQKSTTPEVGLSPDLTAQNLLDKALVAIEGQKNYGFSGTGLRTIELQPNQVLTSQITLEGNESGVQSYLKRTVQENDGGQKVVTEVLITDSGLYIYNNNTWVKPPMFFYLDMLQLVNQGIGQDLKNVKDMAANLKSGSDQPVNGNQCFVISASIDQKKLKNSFKNSISQASNQQDAVQMVIDNLDTIDMNISYKLYINKETFLVEQIDLSAEINSSTDLHEIIDLQTTVYDYESEVGTSKV